MDAHLEYKLKEAMEDKDKLDLLLWSYRTRGIRAEIKHCKELNKSRSYDERLPVTPKGLFKDEAKFHGISDEAVRLYMKLAFSIFDASGVHMKMPSDEKFQKAFLKTLKKTVQV